jgi:hypothetical protein
MPAALGAPGPQMLFLQLDLFRDGRLTGGAKGIEPSVPSAGSITKHNRVLYDPGSGCPIEFPIALLDPPRADMALHRDADMVWAIVRTCCVKFLSGFAGGHGKNPLAQA